MVLVDRFNFTTVCWWWSVLVVEMLRYSFNFSPFRTLVNKSFSGINGLKGSEMPAIKGSVGVDFVRFHKWTENLLECSGLSLSIYLPLSLSRIQSEFIFNKHFIVLCIDHNFHFSTRKSLHYCIALFLLSFLFC